MRRVLRDRLIALVLILCSIILMYIASGFKGDSDVFPIAMAVLVIVSCVPLLLVSNSRFETEEEKPEQIIWSRLVIWLILTCVFFFTIEPLGLFISLPIFILANLLLLARLNIVTAITITAGLTLLVFIVFELMLEVPTPMGLLESILRTS